ncbi:MAG: glucosaminidase domain-containing protein [Firmicutes bacterium]|nr:glucosaminidase domain-containing protein [Bacillota bacterium]
MRGQSMEKAEESKKTAGILNMFSKQQLIMIGAVLGVSVLLLIVGIFCGVNKVHSDAAEAAAAATEKKMAEAEPADPADALRQTAVDEVLDANYIPAYSLSQVMALDVSKPSGVTVEDLKKVTSHGLVGLEKDFWQAEQDYGINCLFVMAIAAIESGNGTINGVGNNMFGWGGGYIKFSSKAEGIDVVARGLARNYLTPGAGLYSGNRISDVNKRYASSSTWDDKVASKMVSYYSIISKTHNTELEKLK